MSKLKAPLFSLTAEGHLSKALTYLRKHLSNIVVEPTTHKDAASFSQLSWRHMYQKAIALWQALSDAEKQSWESLARPFHMTGFAYFISQALKPNPGLYLPLQGGKMAGDIDMDGYRIEDLPDPIANQDADTLIARDAAITTHVAIAAAHHAKYTNAQAVAAAKTVKLDDFATPDDNTDLDSSTSEHGLLKKLDNNPANFLDGQGNWGPAGDGATKHFSIPGIVGFPASPIQTYAWINYGWPLINTKWVAFEFIVPHDFISLTHCLVCGTKYLTGTIDWTATVHFAADGEVESIHTDSDTADGVAMTNTKRESVDISAAFTNLAALDRVSVKFLLDAISAGEFFVHNLDFKYS